MAILFRRANGIYYHISHHRGRRVWRSTGARRRSDAEKFLLDLKVQVKPEEERLPARLTFTRYPPQWMSYGETNLAHSTILLYGEATRNFLRMIGDRDLGSYNTLDIERFKRSAPGMAVACRSCEKN